MKRQEEQQHPQNNETRELWLDTGDDFAPENEMDNMNMRTKKQPIPRRMKRTQPKHHDFTFSYQLPTAPFAVWLLLIRFATIPNNICPGIAKLNAVIHTVRCRICCDEVPFKWRIKINSTMKKIRTRYP